MKSTEELERVMREASDKMKECEERIAAYEEAIAQERKSLWRLQDIAPLREIKFELENSRTARSLYVLLLERVPVVRVLFFAEPSLGVCIVKDGRCQWYDRVSQAVNALRCEKDEIECWAELNSKE